MRIGDHDFVPYVLGAEHVGGVGRRVAALPGTRFLDVLDPASAPFFHRLHAANALAFGDMGMPAWVQLDCATLPSAMIGFALRRGDMPEDLAARLEDAVAAQAPAVGPAQADDLMPLSAFCAVHTREPDTVVAFTWFSLLPGLDLGLRTKAMGLLILRARRQIGVTRRAGPVRALHERLGPLTVLRDRPTIHPAADDTMVYELAVPPAPVLQALVLEGGRSSPDASP